MDTDSLIDSLQREILFARRRIYEIGQPTPLDTISLHDEAIELHVKREDLSPIHAYKWRGAYNCMAQLNSEKLKRGVVTASAGNHAQGVALAAKRLNTRAIIFMPLSTPKMKQVAVSKHGGDNVEIRLFGDTYDAASAAAYSLGEKKGLSYIHAYDDLAVMAGQGTLADEIVMSGKGPFDVAFLQVGGGGMAAATATWLKMNFPGIRIIGVEGIDQASMTAAVKAGKPVELDAVDIFCDGTAVRKAGTLTHQICTKMVDEWMTVTNDEVSAAIQFLWEKLRCIPEPSGAMGTAALLKRRLEFKGKRVLSVLCGSNIDFEQLANVSRRAAVGALRRRFLKIDINEAAGAMYGLLEALPKTANIVDFQYGKTHSTEASPVIGFEIDAASDGALEAALKASGYSFRDVTAETDVHFRLIHYASSLISNAYFLTLGFHERPGALADFLRAVSPHTSLCYFNYVYSGERVGRALLGFEFATETQRTNFPTIMESANEAFRSFTPVTDAALRRILGE